MKTLQDVFDTVAIHLLTQNQRSIAEDDCAYRDGPRKCAVGVLIADEHYTVALEGRSSGSPQVLQALERSGWPCTPAAEGLYYALQCLHDNTHPTLWREELATTAKTFNLDASCLNTESLG